MSGLISSAFFAPVVTGPAYIVRLAAGRAEIEAAQRLRYLVFNQELNEGLEGSALLGLDVDTFDEVCEHLLVVHQATGEVVGTYRLQTGLNARKNQGYYSEQEFDFSPYEAFRPQIMELGRACVHRDHRNIGALHTLWRGIACEAQRQGTRFLMGCSSLTSQSPEEGWAMYTRLAKSYLAEPTLRTHPQPDYVLPAASVPMPAPVPPRLLRAYLALGARICSPPALDRGFKTIDFLTILDLQALPRMVRRHFFES